MKRLYVVGLGPGDRKHMTLEAIEALKDAELLCGYPVYVKLAQEICPETPVVTTPMKHEIERCRIALAKAAEGVSVAMVCSGDAGVYGMAGPILELAAEYPPIDIEIVCGVTAALSGAAVLGAPLTHDFAVISLSDLLTPWEKIEKRLDCAGEADFCIALYNPASHRRADHLKRACDILLRSRDRETICGFVRNIGREGQEYETTTLGELRERTLDMFYTVFIGNSQTRLMGDRMVTPRGYETE